MKHSTQKDIPVYFHNGANYDFNLIIPDLAKEFRSELQCIPSNGEKIYVFLKRRHMLTLTYRLRFIDE